MVKSFDTHQKYLSQVLLMWNKKKNSNTNHSKDIAKIKVLLRRSNSRMHIVQPIQNCKMSDDQNENAYVLQALSFFKISLSL
jgi:hypothetical protein